MKLLVGGEEDATGMPIAQREIILKEIAAFRERSTRRERSKIWFEEEEKPTHDREVSPHHGETRRQTKSQDALEDRRGIKSATDSIPSGPAADRRRGRDFQQTVSFRSSTDRYDREEEDDIPDEEFERRRLDRKRRDLEAAFVDVCPGANARVLTLR